MKATLKSVIFILTAALTSAVCGGQMTGTNGGQVSMPTTNVSAAVPQPSGFTVCFFVGYLDDSLPTDPEVFDSLLTNLVASGFTVIHGTYADWRLEACRKRGIKFMVDMITHEMDYRTSEDKAKALCHKLRGDDAVWGYAVWYAGGCGRLFNPVLEKFHAWDPTHPCFMGSKYCGGIDELTVNPGVLAWEDLDWHENNPQHFADMMKMFKCNQKLGAQTGRWIVMAGREKDRYTLHQSIATGLKTLMWFLGGPWDMKTQKWIPDHYILELNREIRPMYGELMRIGFPVAVYSTPVTRTAANAEVPRHLPEPLVAVPGDFWLSVERGEVLIGVYRYADGCDAVYAANHNAFGAQEVTMVLAPEKDRQVAEVRLFDAAAGGWRTLTRSDRKFTFKLSPGSGALLRFDQQRDSR